MNRTLLALVLAGFAAGPVFAAGDMTCSDFSTLDGDAQSAMVLSMAPTDDASGSMMMGPADDDASGTMGDAAPADDGSGSMMSSDDGSDASGDDDASGAMMSSEGADADQMTANVATLCADHPEMSLDDAMSNAMGN